MSVEIPADPAPNGYIPNPYTSNLERALGLLRTEATSTEGWTEIGSKEDVYLDKKYVESGLPIVRGRGVIENVSPEDLLPVIGLPACRSRWDQRFDSGNVLERYSQESMKFYTVQKGSWPVSPRDIVGAQSVSIASDGSLVESTQTTVPDNDKTPPAYGKVRATLDFAGWVLKKEGSNTNVTYVVHIDLNGSIPSWIVDRVISETPLCVARVRDFYYSSGRPPHLPKLSTTQLCFENLNLDRKEWTANLLAKGEEEFQIDVDHAKMYSGGWVGMARGDAMGDVEVRKEDNVLHVKVNRGAAGKKFEVVIGSA